MKPQGLLVFSLRFPPLPAVGGLRWSRFGSLLAERGWAVRVLAEEPAPGAAVDPGRLADLHPGVEVQRVPRPPLGVERWEAAVRSLLASAHRSGPEARDVVGVDPFEDLGRPDVRRGRLTIRSFGRAWNGFVAEHRDRRWARRAADLALRDGPSAGWRALVSSGPPHAVHVEALRLARRSDLPFVLDLRDPWSLLPVVLGHLASPRWFRRATHLERRVVAAASLVLTSSPASRDALRARYPEIPDRFTAVLNGWDDQPSRPSVAAPRPFRVAWAGHLYLDRDPRPLFAAVARLVGERGLTPGDLRLELVGEVERVGSLPTRALARAAGIEPFLELVPRLPRRELLERLTRCHLAVSLPASTTDLAIPSKLFEYMSLPLWVLGIAAPDSAVGWLGRTAGFPVCDPADVAGLAAVLRDRMAAADRGERPEPMRPPALSRRAQLERLLVHFDALPPRRLSVPGSDPA